MKVISNDVGMSKAMKKSNNGESCNMKIRVKKVIWFPSTLGVGSSVYVYCIDVLCILGDSKVFWEIDLLAKKSTSIYILLLNIQWITKVKVLCFRNARYLFFAF